jgi:hypothetical protein
LVFGGIALHYPYFLLHSGTKANSAVTVDILRTYYSVEATLNESVETTGREFKMAKAKTERQTSFLPPFLLYIYSS